MTDFSDMINVCNNPFYYNENDESLSVQDTYI